MTSLDARTARQHAQVDAQSTRPFYRKRWFAQLVTYVVFVTGVIYVVNRMNSQDAQACEDRRDGRNALRITITESFRPGSAIDFTIIPTFEDLDPATQRYFINLGEALGTSNARTQLRDDLLASVPPIECES